MTTRAEVRPLCPRRECDVLAGSGPGSTPSAQKMRRAARWKAASSSSAQQPEVCTISGTDEERSTAVPNEVVARRGRGHTGSRSADLRGMMCLC